MQQFVLVFVGGGVGAVVRWKLGGWVLHHVPDVRFPLSTFVVNVLGCLIAGMLTGLILRNDAFPPHARLFLFTGVLGGFTTFSAFGVDTFYLIRKHEHLVALNYVVLSVVVSLASLWAGAVAVIKWARW